MPRVLSFYGAVMILPSLRFKLNLSDRDCLHAADVTGYIWKHIRNQMNAILRRLFRGSLDPTIKIYHRHEFIAACTCTTTAACLAVRVFLAASPEHYIRAVRRALELLDHTTITPGTMNRRREDFSVLHLPAPVLKPVLSGLGFENAGFRWHKLFTPHF